MHVHTQMHMTTYTHTHTHTQIHSLTVVGRKAENSRNTVSLSVSYVYIHDRFLIKNSKFGIGDLLVSQPKHV